MPSHSTTGRRLDGIWNYYERVRVPGLKGDKAKCKVTGCNKLVTALVERMWKHKEDEHYDDDIEEEEIDSPVSLQNVSSVSNISTISSDSVQSASSARHDTPNQPDAREAVVKNCF